MPEEYERIKREYGLTGSSILLDLQERITRLEEGTSHAAEQRKEILLHITDLRSELRSANLSLLVRDVAELRLRVLALETTARQVEGGFKAARIVWAVVGGSIITGIGWIISHWRGN